MDSKAIDAILALRNPPEFCTDAIRSAIPLEEGVVRLDKWSMLKPDYWDIRTIDQRANGSIGSCDGGRKEEQKGGVLYAWEDKISVRKNVDQIEEKISWIKGGIERFHLTEVFEMMFFE
jgi:hypothetical protein